MSIIGIIEFCVSFRKLSKLKLVLRNHWTYIWCQKWELRWGKAAVGRTYLDRTLGFSFFISNMEETYIDSLDPEKLLQCPYDKNHQIRASSFPYHLIKCRKNHPDIANKLANCPFSAHYQVPQAEISHHISRCDDKCCIEQDVVNQTRNFGHDYS